MGGRTLTEARRGRLDELRLKVHDESYIDAAVLRIAQVLSAEIASGYGEFHGRRKSR